jgi:hypothetical protein
LVIDYKMGVHGVPHPKDNLQAWDYVCGVFQKFEGVHEIVFSFVCPKRSEVSTHIFYRADLPEMLTRIKGVIRTAMRVRRQFHARKLSQASIKLLNCQSRRCEYCKNLGSCPAVGENLDEDAKMVPLDDVLAINERLKKAPLYEDYIKAVKDHSKQLVFEMGEELPDYTVETRAGKRSITDVSGAWVEAREADVDVIDFLTIIKTVPVGAFEKLFKGKEATRTAMMHLAESDGVSHGAETSYLKRRAKK